MSTFGKPDFDRTLLAELARGAELTFENADALYKEAKALTAIGSNSRALFLHQISLEECAKVETMGAWATSALAGIPIDQKKVLAGMASHAAKNRTNAYMLKSSVEEQDAKVRGDWKAALEAFKDLQTEFHRKSNEAKNASLYVDFADGRFVSPAERVSNSMLTEIGARNKEFLRMSYPKVQMLRKWIDDPEEAQRRVIAFVEVAEATKAENPDVAMAAIEKLIDDFVEKERARYSPAPKVG